MPLRSVGLNKRAGSTVAFHEKIFMSLINFQDNVTTLQFVVSLH